jgi:formylmethanofuran dehydrogenase subunit A
MKRKYIHWPSYSYIIDKNSYTVTKWTKQYIQRTELEINSPSVSLNIHHKRNFQIKVVNRNDVFSVGYITDTVSIQTIQRRIVG